MKKYIFITTFIFFSFIFYTAPSYEDEVRERLGLLKNKPTVTMSSSMDSSDMDSTTQTNVVYDEYCSVCHSIGLAGAPIYGDVAAWEGRVDKGIETLTSNTYNGYNAMPARGGCMNCSEEDIQNAVQYMLDALTVN